MRAIDLCAGAGGWSLGAQRAGWDVHGVEMDADACASHRLNVGPCDQADMREWRPVQSATWVFGGIPCQSHSMAGKRGGTADPRGALYRELLRIAREADAQAITIENVRGIMSSPGEGGSAFHEITNAMRADGWHVRHIALNAADFGVPQNRRRVFLFGFRSERAAESLTIPRQTHGAPGNVLGLPAWRTVRDALGLAFDDPSPCVVATEFRSALNFGCEGGRNPRRAGDVLNPLLRPSFTVAAGGDGYDSRFTRKAMQEALTKARLIDRPSTTVSTGGTLSSAGHHVSQTDGDSLRLQPHHFAALQAFPADFVFTGSKRSQYRQIGNAVPPPLGEVVARVVRDALGLRTEVAA